MNDLKWNKEFAMEQAADDAELLAELIEIFKDSSKNDLATITKGVADEDCELVGGAAHSIKGAAASLGVTGITEVVKMMEEDCRGGIIESSKELLPELKKLLFQLNQL